MEYLKAEHVSFFYDAAEEGEQAQQVLRDVSMEIGKGEFVALLGHNGSGKSTMAKHFNAMLLPSGGRVYVDKMDTMDENLKYEIRRRVGLVLQNPDNQLVASIVEEDVAFGPENLGVPPAEIRRRVDAALETVGMSEYASHSAHKLSGGQKQRVAIAGIIAMRPRCIVLDEPTAMLDPKGRREVISTIKRLNRESGVTVVLITHYMEEAAQCDRVVVMNDGQVLLDDAPRAVFSNVQTLKEVGLDVPQATELCWRLRQKGVDLPGDILTEDEAAAAIAEALRKAGCA